MVTDNGVGMSASDTRMAFERHATSKIREQDDLFRIQTLGFGERRLPLLLRLRRSSYGPGYGRLN